MSARCSGRSCGGLPSWIYGDGARGSLWDLMANSMDAHPSEIAVVEDGVVLTYGLLQEQVKCVSSFLRSLGVGYGSRIATMMGNSVACLQVHMAAADACASVVNLNTNLSTKELIRLIHDSSPDLLVIDSIFLEKLNTPAAAFISCRAIVSNGSHGVLPDLQIPQLSIDSWSEYFSGCSDALDGCSDALDGCSDALDGFQQRFEPFLAPYRTSCDFQVYYTSGTTGMQKQVSFTQLKVQTHAVAMIHESSLCQSDVWAHVSPMFHLVDAFAIFAVTMMGARHVICPRNSTVHRFLGIFEREGVTISNIAATMMSMLNASTATTYFDMSALRLVSCGGAFTPPDVFKRGISAFGCQLFNSYGMSETCGKISISLLHPATYTSTHTLFQDICTVGRKFAPLDLRIVDRDGLDVAPYSKLCGSVLCKGNSVFLGYSNIPKVSEASVSTFTGGWFDTGDLASIDRTMSVVERKKDVILSQSETVFCRDVETILESHDKIEHAVVFGTPDDIMGEMIHAVLVPTRSRSVSLEDVISFCSENMSDYKVPHAFHFLDRIPLNHNGKVLKRALREMFCWPQNSCKYFLSTRRCPPLRELSSLMYELTEEGYIWKLDGSEQPKALLAVFDGQSPELHLDNLAPLESYSRIIILASASAEESTLDLATETHCSICILKHGDSAESWQGACTAALDMIIDCEIGCLYFLKVSLDSSRPQIDSSGTEDSDEIFAALSGVIIEVLGGPEDCIDKNESLFHRGMTSSHATLCLEKLEESFGMKLPVTFLFDYPSLSEMHLFLKNKIFKRMDMIVGHQVNAAEPPSHVQVVHQSSAFCSQKVTNCALSSPDEIVTIPFSRWDFRAQPNLLGNFGYFVDGINLFDSSLFTHSSTEAVSPDPQQRWLLQFRCTATDMLQVGHVPVFVACSRTEYEHLVPKFMKNAFTGVGRSSSKCTQRPPRLPFRPLWALNDNI